jgi:hypothetical protein
VRSPLVDVHLFHASKKRVFNQLILSKVIENGKSIGVLMERIADIEKFSFQSDFHKNRFALKCEPV